MMTIILILAIGTLMLIIELKMQIFKKMSLEFNYRH